MTAELIHLSKPSMRAKANMVHAATAIREHLEREPTLLRPKQVEVVHSVADIFEAGERATYLDLPTGTGKTVIFSQIVNAIQQDGYQPKTLIVTDSQELVEQTKQRFDEHAPHVPVGLYYQHKKEIDKPVIVTTYASFPHFAENHALDFDYLVFDEAHKALSDARLEHTKKFENAVWMALTASPAYSTDKNLGMYFALACKMTVPEAIQENLICSFSNILVESNYANLDNVKLTTTGDYDEETLAKEINIYARNRSAAEFYQSAIDPRTGKPLLGKRGIVNCAGIAHAHDVAKVFQEALPRNLIGGKDACVAIHGRSKNHTEMSPKLRKEILSAHRHGDIWLLANSDLLIHGYDDPTIELCLNLAPTRSLVKVQQRAGRSLRRDDSNPSKIALVVDFMDQTSIEKNKGLLYGDVVGQGSFILPEIEEEIAFQKDRPKSSNGGGIATQPELIDQEYLKGLKISWSAEEVNAVIQKNAFIHQQGSLLGRKQEDELSYVDLAKKMGIDSNTALRILNKLQLDGKTGLYIDPTKYSIENPVFFQIKIRKGRYFDELRCLKQDDFEKFQSIYTPNEPKNSDEFSAYDIAKKMNSSPKFIGKILKRLQPTDDDENLYFDPKEKSIGPLTTFNLSMKRSKNKPILCLKECDLDKFRAAYLPNTPKQNDELSMSDLAKALGLSTATISVILNKLKPTDADQNLYFDPKEKNADSAPIFQIVMRRNTYGAIPHLKADDLEKFQQAYAPKNKKQAEELSIPDIVEKLGTSRTTINRIFNRLQPFNGEEGRYFDPEDKNTENPTTFSVLKKRSSNNIEISCLNAVDFEKFRLAYFAAEPKQPDDLSILDIKKSLIVGYRNANEIIQRLVPLPDKKNLWIDPEMTNSNQHPFIAFEIITRRGKTGDMKCLKENSLDLFAQAYGLQYRDPDKKPKPPVPQ